MTEKQQYALDRIISALPDSSRQTYVDVTNYAISLGYMPKLMGVKENYVDFYKSKIKRSILKITVDSAESSTLALSFFALPEYRGIFLDAIEERVHILNEMGVELHCWGCGKCDGKTIGYPFTLADGQTGFLCGRGVLPLPSFEREDLSEIKEALRVQDDFYHKLLSQ